ncbi:MAG TPA: phage head-tail connector protein [Acidimicrobiia bacterium]
MAITNGYATLQEVKKAARISDAVDDELLEISIESVSRMIDAYCERRFFTAGTETRFYTAQDPYVCDVDDIAGTAITVQTSAGLDGVYDETWQASDLQLEPLNRTASGLTFPVTRLRAVGDYLFPYDRVGETGVKVTAVFGFGTAVPIQVKQATIIMSLRQFKRYDSPLGITAGMGEMGAIRVGRFDPDMQMLLTQFRKTNPGVA